MGTIVRTFQEKDIPDKVRWINDEENNKFLHYDLPLSLEGTHHWFYKNRYRTDRYDAVIEYDGKPIGVIGLLSIKNGKAEYYVTLGDHEYKGKGIAKEATRQLLNYAFTELNLTEVYLYTEVSNVSAQKLFRKCGFEQRDLIKNSAMNKGIAVDRFYYSITAKKFMENNINTQINESGTV